MTPTLILVGAALAGILGDWYFRQALGWSSVIIALLFGGSLALAGLHYLDLRRERRWKADGAGSRTQANGTCPEDLRRREAQQRS